MPRAVTHAKTFRNCGVNFHDFETVVTSKQMEIALRPGQAADDIITFTIKLYSPLLGYARSKC